MAPRTAAFVRSFGQRALAVRADLIDTSAVQSMIDTVVDEFGRLDLLVLNASGGLESDMPGDYAMRLNRDSERDLADRAVAAMTDGGRIVFVTSHEAHFYANRPTLAAYEPVAASKHADEQALREHSAVYAESGISLVVVSGDLIGDTITARMLDRANPGLIETRRTQAGQLPTVEEFAAAVSDAALSKAPAELKFVGTTDH